MLPNHSPYVVAEQYGTLETLYPNRVELGLGRAPGLICKRLRHFVVDETVWISLRKLLNFAVTLKIVTLFLHILLPA